jgi:hypothetical protein
VTKLDGLKPGDIIDGFSSNPDILVTAVEIAEPIVWEDENGDIQVRPMVRYRGRLGRRMAHKITGDPRRQEWQRKQQSWCFPADSDVEIIEAGVVRL